MTTLAGDPIDARIAELLEAITATRPGTTTWTSAGITVTVYEQRRYELDTPTPWAQITVNGRLVAVRSWEELLDLVDAAHPATKTRPADRDDVARTHHSSKETGNLFDVRALMSAPHAMIQDRNPQPRAERHRPPRPVAGTIWVVIGAVTLSLNLIVITVGHPAWHAFVAVVAAAASMLTIGILDIRRFLTNRRNA